MFNKLLKYNKIHENAILQFIIKGTNEKLGEEIHRGQEKSNVGKPLSLCNLGAKSSQFTTMFINWELLPNLFACELLICFMINKGTVDQILAIGNWTEFQRTQWEMLLYRN